MFKVSQTACLGNNKQLHFFSRKAALRLVNSKVINLWTLSEYVRVVCTCKVLVARRSLQTQEEGEFQHMTTSFVLLLNCVFILEEKLVQTAVI